MNSIVFDGVVRSRRADVPRGVTSNSLAVNRMTTSSSSTRISSFVTRNMTRLRQVAASLFVDSVVLVLECSRAGSLAAARGGRVFIALKSGHGCLESPARRKATSCSTLRRRAPAASLRNKGSACAA
ncbi:hypothetical protein ACSFA2_03630 [Variovorax sp. LT2P21]|uniref:hypothetical protein n=1 Tax=Variovorax sp. LT2P21 TaxID=3443731 RepID=UPI003F446B45